MSGRSPIRTFFGWSLMAIGGLIALTCGLCTLGVAVFGDMGGSGPQTVQARLQVIWLALVFGGTPAAGGVGMVIAGWEMTRKREPGVAR